MLCDQKELKNYIPFYSKKESRKLIGGGGGGKKFELHLRLTEPRRDISGRKMINSGKSSISETKLQPLIKLVPKYKRPKEKMKNPSKPKADTCRRIEGKIYSNESE